LADGVDEGARDNGATRLCGYLLRHYIDPIVALELLQIWNTARCRPPLPADDIERIVESIAGKEMRRRSGA
jgi:Primase C terminal 1 (PriCT-1)